MYTSRLDNSKSHHRAYRPHSFPCTFFIFQILIKSEKTFTKNELKWWIITLYNIIWKTILCAPKCSISSIWWCGSTCTTKPFSTIVTFHFYSISNELFYERISKTCTKVFKYLWRFMTDMPLFLLSSRKRVWSF